MVISALVSFESLGKRNTKSFPDLTWVTPAFCGPEPLPLAIILPSAPDEELTPEDKRMLRKVMPIQLTKVNFGNSNGISTYECEAVALNDLAFADQYATIPYDVTLSGPTVSEILWSGKKSLAKQLNFKHLQHKKVITGRGQSKQYKVYGADGKIIASGRGSGPQNAGVTQVKSGSVGLFKAPLAPAT